jgi:Lar family restriction alleviation protein
MKNCPFCGGESYIEFNNKEKTYHWSICCFICHVQTQKRKTRKQAIEDWNKRK